MTNSLHVINVEGHNCCYWKAPVETSFFKCEEVTDEHHVESEPEIEPEPKISLHALTGWSSPSGSQDRITKGNSPHRYLFDS